MLLVRAIVGHQCEALSPLGDLHKSPPNLFLSYIIESHISLAWELDWCNC